MAKGAKSAKRKKPINKQNLYVAAALFCENIIEDKEGVNTIVRIVDKVFVKSSRPFEEFVHSESTPLLQIMAFVSIKTATKQKLRLRVSIQTPSGKVGFETRKELESRPDWGGATLKMQIAIKVREEGAHWLSLYNNKELLTQMPLTVVYQQVSLAKLSSPQVAS